MFCLFVCYNIFKFCIFIWRKIDMLKIKKLFFEQDLTWKKLIIYSIICGVITGIIPLLHIFDKTSIHNIAECYEMWVLLALFIILNSKKPLEAGIKTFVFFLISQPLCYLVQVPFYRDGFGIFMYYRFWAILTLLTFPGAIIAWYTKKENWLSVGILSVAFALLNLELVHHFYTLLNSFPYQLLAVLFILFEIILFIKMIFGDKKKRIVLYVISILLLLLCIYNNLSQQNNQPDYLAMYTLENDKEYSVIEINDNVYAKFTDDFLIVKTKDKGEYIVKLKDEDNNIIELSFIASDEGTSLQLINENN